MDHKHKILVPKTKFRNAARKAASILEEMVGATLGPDGLPILIKDYEGKPVKITKDGVTVANSVFLNEPILDTIIQAIKGAARKTAEEVGDSTTTSIILTKAFIEESLGSIEAGEITPQELRSQIQVLENEVLDFFSSFAIAVKSSDDLKSVAMISSNGDEDISNAVVQAVEMSGEHGLISINEGFGNTIEVLHKEGFQFKYGFRRLGSIGIQLITHNERQTIEAQSPAILVYDGTLESAAGIGTLINVAMANNDDLIKHPIIVCAYEFGADFLNVVMQAKALGVRIIPARLPVYVSHDVNRLFVEDLAAYVGAKAIDRTPLELSVLIKDNSVSRENFGSCERLVMSLEETIFYGGKGDSEALLARVEALRENLNSAASPYEGEILKHRLAMMTGGVVHIMTGATTEFEMKERKDRMDDALCAIKAASKEGIVGGGGSIYVKTALWLADLAEKEQKKERKIAIQVLEKVLWYPFLRLVENAGLNKDQLSEEMARIQIENPLAHIGFDAREKVFCKNLIESKICDAFAAIKSAFKNSLSISMALLTGGGAIVFSDLDVAQEKQDIEGFWQDEKPEFNDNL